MTTMLCSVVLLLLLSNKATTALPMRKPLRPFSSTTTSTRTTSSSSTTCLFYQSQQHQWNSYDRVPPNNNYYGDAVPRTEREWERQRIRQQGGHQRDPRVQVWSPEFEAQARMEQEQQRHQQAHFARHVQHQQAPWEQQQQQQQWMHQKRNHNHMASSPPSEYSTFQNQPQHGYPRVEFSEQGWAAPPRPSSWSHQVYPEQQQQQQRSHDRRNPYTSSNDSHNHNSGPYKSQAYASSFDTPSSPAGPPPYNHPPYPSNHGPTPSPFHHHHHHRTPTNTDHLNQAWERDRQARREWYQSVEQQQDQRANNEPNVQVLHLLGICSYLKNLVEQVVETENNTNKNAWDIVDAEIVPPEQDERNTNNAPSLHIDDVELLQTFHQQLHTVDEHLTDHHRNNGNHHPHDENTNIDNELSTLQDLSQAFESLMGLQAETDADGDTCILPEAFWASGGDKTWTMSQSTHALVDDHGCVQRDVLAEHVRTGLEAVQSSLTSLLSKNDGTKQTVMRP